jgi:membrane fusion protein, multidrug efflux system
MSARYVLVGLCGALLLTQSAVGVPADGVWEVQPVVRQETNFETFTGRLSPVNSVELRARVSGYLDKVNFTDGSDVKKGDVLFEIDPRPYQAELDRANAALVLSEARLKRAETDLARAKALLGRGAVSQEEFDKVKADVDEAKAALMVAKATREVYALNLSWTKVTAPIDGRISRRLLDAGNLVKTDETTLARIITTDPINVTFDMDERTFLKLRTAMADGKLKAKSLADLPVAIGLANEKDFPHKAKIDFVDSQLDATTGAIHVRAVLPNTDGRLMPGLFARVRLTTSDAASK